MKPRFLLIAALLHGSLALAHPFNADSTLPYAMPAFDKIHNADFAPGFRDGMREHRAEIARIAALKDAPTFDNTIVAMERAGQTLGRVSKVFFNLTATNTNPVLEKLERDIAPQLAAHNDAILLDEKLFARIAALYAKRDALQLDPESAHLLQRYYTDFVRAGAKLSAADKAALKRMNQQLATLETRFSQNTLSEANAAAVVVERREQLAGLSDNDIKAAADAASARGLQGKYLLALQNTTGQPFAASLQDRSLRQRLLSASMARGSHGGPFDNRQLVLQLVKLRAERAQLLGYASHAAYQLEDQTAKTTSAVNKMLADLAPASLANAKKEAADIQAQIDAQKGNFSVEAADWDFYAEQVRRARFSFDESQLRPYFELNNVLVHGVFFAATKLYGLTFKERKDLPVYHDSVRVFEVFDADGTPLALFLADMYARPSKRGGAWMNNYVDQSTLLNRKPVVANHLNIPQPPAGLPTLLTPDEVRTAFHEFGHALHGMLSNVRYPRFSGANVPSDFVEFPSQVNEMWAWWPEVLKNYALHYQSGAPMPQALADKLGGSGKFNQGYALTEYLAASLLDQRWHQLAAKDTPKDALAFEAQALKEAGVAFAPVPPRYRTTYFSHIWNGGYSAGYYAYLWSEVLDADTVEWFKENGGLARKNGDWFRQTLLSRGGSNDALQLYRNFRGRDAVVEPLLARRGLKD